MSFSPGHPCDLADVPRWDFAADVIVVGFGSAGASAAIEAAQAGVKVILFERRERVECLRSANLEAIADLIDRQI